MKRLLLLPAFVLLTGCLTPLGLPAPEVSIEPASPAPDDDLVLVLEELPVGEALPALSYQIEWQLDGEVVADLAGVEVVASSWTAVGETWTAVVAVVQGDQAGPSAQVSVEVHAVGDDDDSGPDDDDDVADDDDSGADDDDTLPDDDDATPDPCLEDADGDAVTVCGPDGVGGNADDDCDDDEASVFPGAPETCDGVDQDCDGSLVDEFDNLDGDDQPDCIDLDVDGDGEDGSPGTDCDDLDATIHSGALEVPDDGIDQDCDGSDTTICFEDLDGDGVGSSVTLAAADGDCADTGESTLDNDCDDGDGNNYPGNTEVCDGADNDCNGLDDVDTPGTGGQETDGDGDGQWLCQGDCDDADADNFDGNDEVCDGADNDCDTDVDDADGSLTTEPGMVCVPEGTFWMGCAPSDTQCDADGREEPYHEVWLDAYLVGETEVTVAAYQDCVDAGACVEPTTTSANCTGVYVNYNNWLQSGRDDHPVNCLSWYQAVAYCTWVGGRLPTEAEWEKAARGTDGAIWPWGDTPAADCTYAVMDDGGGAGCGAGTTEEVGSILAGASPYGVLDMAGNLQEWTADWCSSSYYSVSPYSNPTGPLTGTGHCVKPGAFTATSYRQRPSWRQGRALYVTSYAIGFRCADIAGWNPTDVDGDGSPDTLDCDDADASNYPGNVEVCDGADNDCDGGLGGDELDDDVDGVTECDGDCDDADPVNYLGNTEVADGQDNDCDGLVDGDDMLFVALPSGTFDMGCTPGQSGCYSNEYPVHTVTLSNAFWMSETEVTQGQWEGLMENNPSWFSPGGGGADCGLDCPMEMVNWYEALAHANAASTAAGLAECYALSGCTGSVGAGCLTADWCYGYACSTVVVTSATGSVYDCPGYRLPTEAEWEYAARAGTDLLYAGSDVVDDVAWHGSNSGSTTHPVGTKLPNAWALCDLSGNVLEWTWDRMGSAYYGSSPTADPAGPSTGWTRVNRGGSWTSGATGMRVAYRNDYDPSSRGHTLGFRLVRTVP